MLHQVHVIGEIAPDLGQPVSELLPLGEQLLEAGKTAIHRRAPGVDDLRIRQDQVDQADVAEIVGHLVDEEGRALPVDGRVLDVLLAEGLKLIGGKIVQHLRILRLPCLAAAQPVGQRQDIGQFQRSVHLAVAGEDLFQQRGTRARQTDDENGIGRFVSRPFAACEQVRRASLALLCQFGAHRVGIIAGLRAFERVAAIVMAETRLVVLAVLVRLAQCEGKVDLVHEGKVGPLGLLLHRRHLGIGETVGLEVGQRIPGIAVIGLCRTGRAIAGNRPLGLARRLERVAAAGEGGRIAGHLFQHGLEQGEGAFVISGLHRFDGQVRLEQRVVRIGFVKAFGLLPRTVEFLATAKRVDVVEVDLHVFGLEQVRAFQQELRIVQDTQLDADLGQQPHALHVLRMGTQEMAADFLGPQHAPFVKVVGDGYQFARQGGDALRLRLCARRFRAGLQFAQCAPACIQRGIEPRGALEGSNRAGRVSLRARKMAGLLPGAPVFRHHGVQARQHLRSLVMLTQIAQGDGRHVQRLPVAGIACQHLPRHGQPPCKISRLQGFLRQTQLLVAFIHVHAP